MFKSSANSIAFSLPLVMIPARSPLFSGARFTNAETLNEPQLCPSSPIGVFNLFL